MTSQVSADEWINIIYILCIHTQWNIIQPRDEVIPAICGNMDEPREHYAK